MYCIPKCTHNKALNKHLTCHHILIQAPNEAESKLLAPVPLPHQLDPGNPAPPAAPRRHRLTFSLRPSELCLAACLVALQPQPHAGAGWAS
jgi:hypothetical protein